MQNNSNISIPNKRLASIDVFRGATIAGMIIVINPGSWKYIYSPLKHANWHGWTFADLVFPFFLFIVGVSVTFSLSKSLEKNIPNKSLYQKIIKRTIILFALGLFINLLPEFKLAEIRIMGVLQRIAICYLIVSLLVLNTSVQTQIILSIAFLFIYAAVMEWIPIKGVELGSYEKGESVATYLDKIVLKGYMGYYEKIGEPEGILSTLPSLSSTLFGVLTGHYLKLKRNIKSTSIYFSLIGLAVFLLGLFWSSWMPINKHLWTSSYALITTGLALILFGFLYYLIDGLNYKKWAKPFVVFGMNAITVYVLSIVLAKVIKLLTFTNESGDVYHVRSWLYENILVELFGNYSGSLVYSILYTSIWCGIMWVLYNKKIFIKV